MLDAANFRGDLFDVNVGDIRLGHDLGRGRLGNDAEIGLFERQRGLEVIPLLHAVRVAEYLPELIAGPQVLDQRVIEYARGHLACTPGD